MSGRGNMRATYVRSAYVLCVIVGWSPIASAQSRLPDSSRTPPRQQRNWGKNGTGGIRECLGLVANPSRTTPRTA